jgi:hypothetical protein
MSSDQPPARPLGRIANGANEIGAVQRLLAPLLP